MIQKGRYLIAAAVMAVLAANVCFGETKTTGFQYWNSDGISTDINQDWQVTIEQEERFFKGAGILYYEHTDLGFMRKNVTPWMDLSFNFREVIEKNSKNEMKDEKRPYMDATFKTKLLGCDFSDRSRFEYRDLQDRKDVWRYRNKPMIRFPVELTPLKLKPFIADDMFFDLNQEGFNQNWLIGGFLFDVTKNLKCEISWMWQAKEAQEEWENANILITRLKFNF